jgi:hypothetical protein
MKPILCGMNNPLSTRPGHELYPAPEGCTGHRLWRMLNARTGAFRQHYLDTFERRNLVRGLEYDKLKARARAHEMVMELRDSGRTVVLLGQDVRRAFDHALGGALPPVLIHPTVAGGCTWRQIPHPSGRNLYYNDPENRKVVELLMEELYVEYRRRSEVAAATA